ncbi:MAG: RDD family protein [Verrucomicrobia bacterium]|nr:RDD family protein [Verrucomicrobiota bacterium]
MANPPPIPPPPAGYWWRTFACLADILPLMFLGWALAGMLADADELAARQKADAWTHRFTEQYVKAIKSGSPSDMKALSTMTTQLLDEKSPDGEAFLTWYSFQGNVSFVTMLLALALQEWLLAGRTLGKRIFNLRTISLPDAEPPGFLAALLRSAWKAAFFTLPNPLFMLVGIINFHVPLFRRDKRSWHDLWTRTQVVDNKLS